MSGWVCPKCGLDYDTVTPVDAVRAVRSYPRRYRSLLTSFGAGEDGDALVRRRPDPSMWSALEYTGHVADMLEAFAPVIRRMTVEDEPTLELPDGDERAAAERYNDQPVADVLSRLDTAAGDLAGTLESVEGDAWSRTAKFPWGERDALTMARNAVHEGSHHLRDAERVLGQVRGGKPPDEEDD